jgi:hypothetical protein
MRRIPASHKLQIPIPFAMTLRPALVLSAATVIMSTGCASSRMGLSKAEWEAMTERERRAFRVQYERDCQEFQREMDARRQEIERLSAKLGAGWL